MAFLSAISGHSRQERFSLLHLEPSEIYIEGFLAFYYLPNMSEDDQIKRKQRGRLNICSKSVVFEPNDVAHPIIKFPFSQCEKICRWDSTLLSRLGTKGSIICMEPKQMVKLKENNVIAPYIVINTKQPTQHLFSLMYAGIDDCLARMHKMLHASHMPIAEQELYAHTIVENMLKEKKFDNNWLDDFHEPVITRVLCDRITPLVVNPGIAAITNQCVYFQSFNNIDPMPVLKMKLKTVKQVYRRRFTMRPVAIEILFKEGAPLAHLYLSMRNTDDRENFYQELHKQPGISLEDGSYRNVLMRWQNHALSNFQYLTILNDMAGRSFNDLTQYPVFPWILTDYTSKQLDLAKEEIYRDLSKPIGALNEERLKKLKTRYNELSEGEKFLYGSHYSTPAFVLWYLVRVAPEYMLCLQNGSFDRPDRMFNSIPETWCNVITSDSDFKELIPEFFDGHGEFLENRANLNFGLKQDGSFVNHVDLPPWATDARDFIDKNRQALESEYVSSHLHEWIDLIFGCKQRGEEAKAANNEFVPATYEGNVDLESIEDINQRYCMALQLNEFGQIPQQIFTKPHPKRLASKIPEPDPSENASLPFDSGDAVPLEKPVAKENHIKKVLSERSRSTLCYEHKDVVTSVRLNEEGTHVFSVSNDGMLRFSRVDVETDVHVAHFLTKMTLSSIDVLQDGMHVVVGSWDNRIFTYSCLYCQVVNEKYAHDDAVSMVQWRDNMLFSSSWDSTVKIWTYNAGELKAGPQLKETVEHEAGVCCMDVSSDSKLIASGCSDGQVYVWDTETGALVSQQQCYPSGKVSVVQWNHDNTQLLTVGEPNSMLIWNRTSGSEKPVVHYTSSIKDKFRCASYAGHTLFAGTDAGDIMVFDLLQPKSDPTFVLHGHDSAVISLAVPRHSSIMASGSEDKTVRVWQEH